MVPLMPCFLRLLTRSSALLFTPNAPSCRIQYSFSGAGAAAGTGFSGWTAGAGVAFAAVSAGAVFAGYAAGAVVASLAGCAAAFGSVAGCSVTDGTAAGCSVAEPVEGVGSGVGVEASTAGSLRRLQVSSRVGFFTFDCTTVQTFCRTTAWCGCEVSMAWIRASAAFSR